MSLNYDGEHLLRSNENDMDAYTRYLREQDKSVEEILREAERESVHTALHAWYPLVPRAYKKSMFSSVKDKYPEAATHLEEAINEARSTEKIPSLMVASENIKYKGKTWTIYAYLKALVRYGLLEDPEHQIKVLTESELVRQLSDFSTRNAFSKKVFESDVKVLVIDNIGAPMTGPDENKRGSVWADFNDKARQSGIAFVLGMALPTKSKGYPSTYTTIEPIASDCIQLVLKDAE
jgi:hypothetical protein